MNNSQTTTVGTGFATLLTVTFIILKLCKVIDWSWIWVLAPSWISLILDVLVIIVYIIVSIIN